MKKKLAWVTGTKPNGYELVVTMVESTSQFQFLNHKFFGEYRAAQDIANAVNSHVAAKLQKQKSRKGTPP